MTEPSTSSRPSTRRVQPGPGHEPRKGLEIKTEIDQIFAAGPGAASEARRSLDAIAAKVSKERFEDIRLLVSELVTNSVRHSGAADHAKVEFRVLMDISCLRVEVADSGKGFQKTVTPSTPDQISGWGLQFLERLSDRWGVDPRDEVGSTVWFEIDL